MGRVKEMWMEQIDEVVSSYEDKKIDVDTFRQKMRELHVSDEDIDETIYFLNDREDWNNG